MFETRTQLFIVMRLVKGGDLFERIKTRKFFPENVAREVMWSLFSAIRYLHARGIVHRDLKPENILCLDEKDDSLVMISDFGLSKFASSVELMKIACGTLCYVAPEVLKMQGYSFSVDIWSLGVIMYLLLRGRLPFDGKTKDEIIDRTITAAPDFTHPHWQMVSEEAKDLVAKLLNKDPKLRFTEEQARLHSWFEPVRRRMVPTTPDVTPYGRQNKLFSNSQSSSGVPSPCLSSSQSPVHDKRFEPLLLDDNVIPSADGVASHNLYLHDRTASSRSSSIDETMDADCDTSPPVLPVSTSPLPSAASHADKI